VFACVYMLRAEATCVLRALQADPAGPRPELIRIGLVAAWSVGLVCAVYYAFAARIFNAD